MPYFHVFLWDGLNEEHLADHGITTEEFEQVVLAAYQSDIELSRSSGRPVAIGRTEADRKICCVFEIIDDIYCYPVTAFDVD